jgi:hypothetical protein
VVFRVLVHAKHNGLPRVVQSPAHLKQPAGPCST